MANIAEGFDRKTDKDFIKFLYIAVSSASELQSHLYIALDAKYITDDIFNELYYQIAEVKKMIYGFIKYLNR